MTSDPSGPRTTPTIASTSANFWLRQLFAAAEKNPDLLQKVEIPLAYGAFFCSASIRHGTLANARRLLGESSTVAARKRLAREVIQSFLRFCCDMGRSIRQTPEALRQRVASIRGHQHYLDARAAHRGLIVVTAHMGSFEIALATLAGLEKVIHVVFKRDQLAPFERQRSQMRKNLGVIEAPLDEGWPVWLTLRDALEADQAVVLQGDRVMPGQKGMVLPFMGAHLSLPTGPVRLSQLTGAPILPVFSIRDPDGEVTLQVEPPIWPVNLEGTNTDADELLAELAKVLERQISAHPDQWLILEPAFEEDRQAF